MFSSSVFVYICVNWLDDLILTCSMDFCPHTGGSSHRTVNSDQQITQ